MMRIALLLVLCSCTLSPGQLYGQLNCGFNSFDQHHSDEWIDRGLSHSSNGNLERADVILPVVFHNIQDGNQGAVDPDNVRQLLAFLNQAFANEGFYDPGSGASTNIGFCLAKQDESGLPTSGITTTQSPLTALTVEIEDEDLKALIHWDPYCYINIYLVDEIKSQSSGAGVQGYANFPSSHGSATDGIVIESRLVDGSPVNAAVTIHEMGHYLGLYHTFRGGCQNDDCLREGDRICDTPPDNSTAPADCSDPFNSCTTDANSGLPNDEPDMVTNYMDYGYLSCRNAFTQGQADRMQMAINMERTSLLGCQSCQDPCPTPFSTLIGFDSLNVRVNAPFKLWADMPPSGSSFEWYEGGVIIGTQDTLNTPSLTEGERTIILKTTGQDPRCVSYDTIVFQVYCDAMVSHSVRDSFCLTPGSTLVFDANGLNLSQPIEWYINDVLDQTGNQFSWIVPPSGVYELFLVGRNDDCEYRSTTYQLYVNCREICGNEIDDDGDGLIDGYDDDCCDSLSYFFFDPCYESCPTQIKDAFTSISRKYTVTGLEYHEAGSPLVGDVDGDGTIEIIGTKSFYILNGQQRVSKNYLIINGEDGTLQMEFDPGGSHRTFSQQLAIADTDRNGYAEIYSFSDRFTRFDFQPDGSLTRSFQRGGLPFLQPTITDIDEDGQAEIVTGNGIFDASTGAALIGRNTSQNSGRIDWVASSSGSAVIDVLPDDFCANCSGKELIVGNEVYSVLINRQGQSQLNLEVALGSGDDGYTSIADMDLDGDLDAVVIYTTPLPDFMTMRHVFVWDLQTPTMLLPELTWQGGFQRIGQATLGDVNGDGAPEVIVADYENLRCMGLAGNQWITHFIRPNNDRSGLANPSVFDFDSDGRMEVIHRNESTLLILEGTTGLSLFQEPCKSGTGFETPVVADVDGDREAELVCNCENELRVYEPNPGTWALTRPVWNQFLYYTLNVNDDLTIPAQEQRQHLPGQRNEFNNYIFQYGTREFKASDLTASILDKDCNEDNVIYQIQICNIGPSAFDDVLKLRGYNQDPLTLNANLSYIKDTVISQLRPDSCFTATITFSRSISNLHVVLNDEGNQQTPFDLEVDFPTTGIFECDYTNNIVELNGVPIIAPPDLGPDTSMCDFGTFLLDAGEGYASYRWPDLSDAPQMTVWQPGTYWVEVQDSCGKVYTDTIHVGVDPSTIIDLGPDLNVCRGDTANLVIDSFESLTWSLNGIDGCDTCGSLLVRPDSTITITVLAETEDGCFGFDSVRIFVEDAYFQHDSVNICPGDSILFDGAYRYDAGVYQRSSQQAGCDSLFRLTVFLTDQGLFSIVDTLFIDSDKTGRLSVMGDHSQIEEYIWQSGLPLSCTTCPDPMVDGGTSGMVTVDLILKNGCVVQLTTFIVVSEEGTNVFIPNTFSPNRDGVNDRLTVYTNDKDFSVERMVVYDRWGELIYQEGSNELSLFQGWDGRFNGSLLNPGVFVVEFVGRSSSGEVIQVIQSVTLVR